MSDTKPASDLKPTSELTILSTKHGKLRCAERNIDKRDLQEILKYGTSVRTYNSWTREKRWRITHAGMVYVTDDAKKKLITCYTAALPLNALPLTNEDESEQAYWAAKLLKEPKTMTSHTVLVIDLSASMGRSDVDGHYSRLWAVYYTLAQHFVGGGTGANMGFTDAVSVVEMRHSAELVLDRVPYGRWLHNWFVRRAKRGWPYSHGNFMPALEMASKQLARGSSDSDHALSLYFLSDGRPSDAADDEYSWYHARSKDFSADFLATVQGLSQRFGQRLTVTTVGVGQLSDFEMLKKFAGVAQQSGAIEGRFFDGGLSISQLSTSVTSMMTSLVQTKLGDDGKKRTEREISINAAYSGRHARAKYPQAWDIFVSPNCQRQVCVLFAKTRTNREYGYEYTYHVETFRAEKRNNRPVFLNPIGCGLAVCKTAFGKGAERMVFEASEIDSKRNLCGIPLVAKESKFVQDLHQEAEFHKVFCRSQRQASRLAEKFNDIVFTRLASSDRKSKSNHLTVPKIRFLAPAIYKTFDGSGNARAYLVEPRLPLNLKYQKWNDNAGMVRGSSNTISREAGGFVPPELAESEYEDGHVSLEKVEDGGKYSGKVKKTVCFKICEEDEAEAEDDDFGNLDDVLQDLPSSKKQPKGSSNLQPEKINNEDIPQAFTHFTYHFTQRHKMVCDLQGVLFENVQPPIFELTDPVIHFSSSTRKNVFGRTDKGKQGMRDFFRSHKCNAVCRLLRIDHDSVARRQAQQ